MQVYVNVDVSRRDLIGICSDEQNEELMKYYSCEYILQYAENRFQVYFQVFVFNGILRTI